MSVAKKIFDEFAYRCRDGVVSSPGWDKTGYEFAAPHNYGDEWVMMIHPERGEKPNSGIDVQVDSSPCLHLRIGATKVGVNADGTPVDQKTYDDTVAYVVGRLLQMLRR